QTSRVDLTFVRPHIGNLTKTVQVSGIIDADQKATMRFAAGGKVVYLGADEGEYVERGQTIATIDRRELEKRLQQDLNTFMQERLDWDQTNDDIFEGEFTKAEDRTRQQAQLNLSNEVLDVEIRDIAIRNTVLSAPFAGILVSSPTTVTGVNLLATDAFELVDPTTLIFRAGVDEADIGLVKYGQPAQIELDAYPDQTIMSQVATIDLRSSQSNSGTIFIVKLPLNSQDIQRYRLGMNGDVTIEVDHRQNTMIIPLDATRQRDDKVLVDIRTGEDTYEERVIETGLETDDEIEVVSGLSENDEVLLPE
ncbi:MAG TPA: efflux RND transporter periplasmic adaptor subunit, partial [Patescibacteria group bacterium]